MPPKRAHHDESATPKEKANTAGAPAGRGRRNNAMGPATVTSGSHLKEVMSSTGDNASTHSGQTEQTAPSVRRPSLTPSASPRSLPDTYRPADTVDRPRPCPPAGLPPRLPPRHAILVQAPAQHRRPRLRHRQVLAHDGAASCEATSYKGAARARCAQELQRRQRERERCYC